MSKNTDNTVAISEVKEGDYIVLGTTAYRVVEVPEPDMLKLYSFGYKYFSPGSRVQILTGIEG